MRGEGIQQALGLGAGWIASLLQSYDQLADRIDDRLWIDAQHVGD
jgi:hypothetical protein